MKSNVAIVNISHEITSRSGDAIAESLIGLYQKEFSCSIFAMNSGTPRFPEAFCREFKNFQKIVFPSFHIPSPELLKHLRKLATSPAQTEVIFHVYGNFLENIPLWKSVEEILLHFKVQFHTPSEAHTHFLSQFLNGPDQVRTLKPGLLPGFKFSENDRKEMRRHLGVDRTEKIFIYTGRLTIQKNIHSLILEWSKFAALNADVRLILVGGFDDLSDPRFGDYFVYGYYERFIVEILSDLPQSVRERIDFIPFRPVEIIRKLLCAADCYVTFSIHHDEDYGLSVHEALQTGLPVVAADWGGLRDYADFGARLLPVKGTGKKRRIKPDAAGAILLEETEKIDQHSRKKRASSFQVKMNERSVYDSQPSELQAFKGFNETFLKAYKKVSQTPWAPFNEEDLADYLSLYRCYYP